MTSKSKIIQQLVTTLKKVRKVRNLFGPMLFSCMAELAKQESPRMFASPIEAYASVEHSAIRGMYVDPDRLDRSLERSI